MSDILDRVNIDNELNQRCFYSFTIEPKVNHIQQTSEARSKHWVHFRSKEIHSEFRIIRNCLALNLDQDLPLIAYISSVLKNREQNRRNVAMSDPCHHHLKSHLDRRA